MGAVLLGVMCSNAFAVSQDQQQTSQNAGVTNINQFDISAEIKALKQAKSELENAVKSITANGGDSNQMLKAVEQFKNKEDAIFAGLSARRQKEYKNIVFTCSSDGHGRAKDKAAPFKPHRYDRGSVRISNPDKNNLEMIPGSGRWDVLNKKGGDGGYAEVKNPRQEGSDYIVDIEVKGPDFGHRANFIDIRLYAQYRYTQGAVTTMVNADMATLKTLVKSRAQ